MKPSSAYINGLREDMRHAVAEFRKYDREWTEIDKLFKDKIRKENQIRIAAGREPHTALSIANQRKDTLILVDAMAAATWWRDKALTLAAAISAEEAAVRMLEGSSWP